MSGEVAALVERVAADPAVSTATVSDALDLLGLPGALPGIRALGGARRAGPAFTVAFEPVELGGSAPAADYVDDVPAGSVVVLANGGREDCTVWGGLLSQMAQLRGLAGTVVDGVCRDVDETNAVGHAVWARGVFMRSGKNRARMVAAQVPVTVAGVAVAPGDAVVADGNGVVVVAAAAAGDVARLLDRVVATEQAVLAAVRDGVPLREARAAHGYHAIAYRQGSGDDAEW